MKKLTLQPGEWTEIEPRFGFQNRSNRAGIRMHLIYDGRDGTIITAPPVDTDIYFVIPEFDSAIQWVSDKEWGTPRFYVMPDDDVPVDVVVL